MLTQVYWGSLAAVFLISLTACERTTGGRSPATARASAPNDKSTPSCRPSPEATAAQEPRKENKACDQQPPGPAPASEHDPQNDPQVPGSAGGEGEPTGPQADLDEATCMSKLGTKLWQQGACHDFDVTATAPRIYLHSQESFFPSSVDSFFAHTEERGGYYTTKQPLGCADCYDPPFLLGQRPIGSVVPPTYVLIVPKQEGIIDVSYWMFYPYNRGKRVCVGYFSPFGCVGSYKSFAHHVGDWEHITIRFVEYKPQKIYVSAHNFGSAYEWKTDSTITYEGDHPVLYAALGSHGVYASPGAHTYNNLPNGDRLYDELDAGVSWDTWHHLDVLVYDRRVGAPASHPWLSYPGRWGNSREECDFWEAISNECVLNPGPTGPATKGAVTSDQLE